MGGLISDLIKPSNFSNFLATIVLVNIDLNLNLFCSLLSGLANALGVSLAVKFNWLKTYILLELFKISDCYLMGVWLSNGSKDTTLFI